jgi:hypothetical protein
LTEEEISKLQNQAKPDEKTGTGKNRERGKKSINTH